jgi:hypothetical protein
MRVVGERVLTAAWHGEVDGNGNGNGRDGND